MQKTNKITPVIISTALVLAAVFTIAALSTVKAQEEDKTLKSVASRCVGAQSKIRALQQQTTEVGNKRVNTFEQIDGRLWVAIGKLKIGEKDTTAIEKARAELYAQTQKYNELNQTYIQSLADVALVGCTDDPATFVANLEIARGHSNEIRTLNTEIRTYITENVRPALSEYTGASEDSDELDEGADTEDDDSSEGEE